jgi:LysR family hydrogen peroxide-inducible transcriptional activator
MLHVRFFQPPAPVREISVVTHRGFTKRRLIEALKLEIMRNLPPQVQQDKPRRIVEIS